MLHDIAAYVSGRTSSADPDGLHGGHEVIFGYHTAGFHSASELLFEQ